MKVLCISEHFAPRVGGTAHYADAICTALTEQGQDVCLIVPGPKPELPHTGGFAYHVEWCDAGWPVSGEPTRDQRYRFCLEANRRAQISAETGGYSVCHVLFGLFLMETIETPSLHSAGVASVATVHNVPPMECGRSWPGDRWYRRLADAARLRAVSIKNEFRLRRYRYAAYVTPSRPVKAALEALLPGADLKVIAHGVTPDLLSRVQRHVTKGPSPRRPLKLLTVGGWVPHKRQHVIPATANLLQARGLDFQWHLAGPASRISHYKNRVDNEIAMRRLAEKIITHDTLSLHDLARLYEAADIYVQPSTEEGFCITALDAAAVGVPVVGSPAGALPELCELSAGKLASSNPEALANAILEIAASGRCGSDRVAVAMRVQGRYSWAQTASELVTCYREAIETIGGYTSRERNQAKGVSL